jgi:hypothetical protein
MSEADGSEMVCVPLSADKIENFTVTRDSDGVPTTFTKQNDSISPLTYLFNAVDSSFKYDANSDRLLSRSRPENMVEYRNIAWNPLNINMSSGNLIRTVHFYNISGISSQLHYKKMLFSYI